MHERAGDTTGSDIDTLLDNFVGDLADISLFQGLQLEAIRTHHWHVLRCSAMTGTNLKEGLAWVVDDAKKRLFLY